MVESCMLGYFGLSSVSCSVVQWGVTRSASTATKISRYTEQIVCPNNATQTMQNETWCPHTHTYAHCCPTSEHLLKCCTLKFMLKEKCTCLLKHSGHAVKWRLLLFWSHDLSVFLKSTGKHHKHIPLSRMVLTHTHTKHKPLVTPTLVVVVVHIKQLHLALSQGRIHSHTISRKLLQTHTLNYFNSTLELVHNRFLTCTNALKKPAMPHAPLHSIISCSLYTKFRKHTRVLTYY